MSIGFLRNRQQWFTKSVLIILAVTFVLGFGYVGGISIGGGGTGSTTAVKVNGEKVPLSRYYIVRENLYRRFGQGSENIPEAAKDYINYSAMKQIIEGKLLAQKARDLGFTITDEELGEAIRSNPSFQYNGQFIGKKNYEETVKRALNISVSEFEEGFRDELLVRKLVELIDETAKVTDEELLNLYRMQNEEISLNYLVFSPDEFKNPELVKETDIRDYYENNKQRFKTEEKRKIKYVKISGEDFHKSINITDDEIEAYYNSYKNEFKDEEGNIRELVSVREEIGEILKNRKSSNLYDSFTNSFSDLENKDIEEVVTENSLNSEIRESDFLTASAENDQLPQYVIKKAFAMDLGELAQTRGRDNTWLIQLVDKKEPGQQSFEEAKDQIASMLVTEKAKNAARIAAEETLNKIKEKGRSLTQIAGSTGKDVKQSEYFTRMKAPSFINNEEMKLDAFMLEKDNPIASRIYNSEESFYIISLRDKKEIDISDFSENKEKIQQQELVRLRRNILSGWINELYSKAKIVYNDKVLPELSITPASS